VVESNPVADFVRQGTAQICRSESTSGKSRVTNDDAIVLGVVIIVVREGSVTEKIYRVFVIERDGIDVERVGTATSESSLHCCLFWGIWANVHEPFGIIDPGGANEFELETSSSVVPIQDIDLIFDLLIPRTGRMEG